MSAAEKATAVSAHEADALFTGLEGSQGFLVALSGGPDSTALLLLLARWRERRAPTTGIRAATVDHGLRPESRREAAEAANIAGRLGISHRVLAWCGEKPRTRVGETARAARYELLAREAERVGVADVVTAHTLDDQAETVLLRLAAGSGIAGLGAMARVTPLRPGLRLVRPLLSVPKARLIATCNAERVPFTQDPSNGDPKFARARLRAAREVLVRERLTAVKLARLAERAQRAEAALAWAAAHATAALDARASGAQGRTVIPLDMWRSWPSEIGFRVLYRVVAEFSHDGPIERGKLERILGALNEAVARDGRCSPGGRPWSRTLAGALIVLMGDEILVTAAPMRRARTRDGSKPSPVRTKTLPLPLA